MENRSDGLGNRKYCAAKEGRGGVKCRKQSDNLLEGYAHRREAERLMGTRDWIGPVSPSIYQPVNWE